MESSGEKMGKANKRKLVLYIALITVFLGLIVYAAVRFGPQLTELARKPEDLRNLLNSFGWKGILVFMGIQMLQVVVAAIPGEFVQLAGGYIYGTWFGTLYSLIGIVLGSILVFFIARLLGYPVVKLLVSPKQLEKFNFMINSEKSEIGMFIFFLIPGIPKDVLTYIAGITPVKPLRFFIIITVGRLPALLASSYIGYSAQKGNYGVMLILSIAALVLFLTGIILKDKIIKKVHSMSGNRSK
jgi:uncharacterized membrane protein YdjX (TVP38/TMEM64 family)